MIFGVNATKSAIVVAQTKGASAKFVTTAIRPIPFQVRSEDNLAELLQTLISFFQCKGNGACSNDHNKNLRALERLPYKAGASPVIHGRLIPHIKPTKRTII